MNLMLWLVIGGVLGWLASLVMRTDHEQEMFMNVVVGIVGALIGGWLVSPLLGAGTLERNDFSPGSVLVSLLGGVLLLALVNLFRRGRVR